MQVWPFKIYIYFKSTGGKMSNYKVINLISMENNNVSHLQIRGLSKMKFLVYQK